MIQEVIDNLISLEENLKSQRDSINNYTQGLARAKFKEILEEIGVDFDVDKLTFIKGYRDKSIIIELKQDNYYRNLKMEVSSNTDGNWVNFYLTVNNHVSLKDNDFYDQVNFQLMCLQIQKQFYLDHKMLTNKFDELVNCFNSNKNLETKIEVVQHLLKNAQQSLDLIKVNNVFDTGKCKAEYDRYVKSFGSKEKYASEIHFTKNQSGTYTASLLDSNGNVVSNSTRASSHVISEIVCKLLELRTVIYI